jgi:site-specific DNA-methyltransferase (adenine-specific)
MEQLALGPPPEPEPAPARPPLPAELPIAWAVREGDAVQLLRALPADSIDAVVTDPPYGLEFMGKAWDRVPAEFHREWAAEALRVLKPGGYLLAFGGTRTYHRLACGIEDAGLEIKDALFWFYGSGWPKSRAIAGDVERLAGADAAAAWKGWGTALKPACEPIVLARKPHPGTVGENLVEHGVGALHVDACRIEVADRQDYERNCSGARGHEGTRPLEDRGATDLRIGGGRSSELGRWPANVVLDEDSAAFLDEQAGEAGGRAPVLGTEPSAASTGVVTNLRRRVAGVFHGDSGGPSRFFYTAKASASERNAQGRNAHPTVKPVALLRWLCRLVAAKGAIILDPFSGSGSCGIAALAEGFRYLGFERDPESVVLARRRIGGRLFAGEGA